MISCDIQEKNQSASMDTVFIYNRDSPCFYVHEEVSPSADIWNGPEYPQQGQDAEHHQHFNLRETEKV